MAAAKHKNADIVACMLDRREIPTPISTFVGPADQMQPLLILYGLRVLPEIEMAAINRKLLQFHVMSSKHIYVRNEL